MNTPFQFTPLFLNQSLKLITGLLKSSPNTPAKGRKRA